jgi:hypothetical protein
MSSAHARSIRDIAHLYISSPLSRSSEGTILVAGIDAETIPGFHTANLAVALALLGRRVRLVERCGLLLNAARFLALPPQVYAGRNRPASSVKAFDGLDVWFDTPPPGAALNVIHAPPLASQARALDDCDGDVVALLIVRSPSEIPRRVVAACPSARCLVVDSGSGGDVDTALEVAGTVRRWHRSLCDVIPVPLRDRRSRLARAYLECARGLLNRCDERRVGRGQHSGSESSRAAAR